MFFIMCVKSYGNGSIDSDNCTLYNNTAQYGGGMYMRLNSKTVECPSSN